MDNKPNTQAPDSASLPTADQLTHYLDLLQVEKTEDLRLYQARVLDRSLKERVQKGVTWFPLPFQRLYIGMGERLVVELQRPPEKANAQHAFQVGDAVKVFGKEGELEIGRLTGVIASLRGGLVRIALHTDKLPHWLQHGSLGVDLDFDDRTYQEMEKALRKVMDAPKESRLAALREILLGQRKASFHEWEVGYQNPKLNPSQNQAVQQALAAHDVAVIHGPPGTGKTTTLVAAIQEILHHEHQVLVCAPSNTAVDLLTLKCLEAGLEVVRLGNPARVEPQLLEHTLDGTIEAHPDYDALRKLRREAETVRQQAHKFKRHFGPEQKSRRRELMREARELKALAHKLEDYILHQVLHRTPVITCTLTGASHSVLGKKHFHTVLIDEAGQALAPACWIPILRADRVIMAGDHCQLPPTVKSFAAAQQGLGYSLFEQVMAQQEVSVMLNQQYRMHQQIMGFSARQFYDQRLLADASVQAHVIGP